MPRAVLALARSDSAGLRAIRAEARTVRELYLPWEATLFAERPAEAVALLHAMPPARRGTLEEAFSHWTLGATEAAAGRWSAAVREYASTARILSSLGQTEELAWLDFERAACAALPTLPVPRRDLLALRDRVERWDVSAPLAGASRSPELVLRPQMRLYLLGVLDARLGAHDAALRHAAALERMTPPPEAGNFGELLSRTVRAAVASERGDAPGVLAAFQGWRQQVPPWYSTILRYVGAHGRWLRADALRALDRDEAALAWFRAVPEAPVYETPTLEASLLAPSLLRRAELYERLGDREAARDHYQRFADLWARADPEAQAAVRTARERAARLASDR